MTDVWKELRDEQFQYLNDFICGNTKMYYEESALYDYIGIIPYTVNSYFPFTCKSMVWANNRIRTQYFGGVGRLFNGISWNSSQVPDDFNAIRDYGKDIPGVNKTEEIHL